VRDLRLHHGLLVEMRRVSRGGAPLREEDLYAPVKSYLVANGYEVRGEVRDCDLTAMRGEELVVVELKRAFGLRLLEQAVNRQRAADSVYVAIPRPPRGRFSKAWWDMCHLLERLELGLLTVRLVPEPEVEVVLHPQPREPKRNARLRRSIIREFSGRSGDYNTGGSAGRSLVTAYRENALQIAFLLERHGPCTPARLRELGSCQNTYGILYRNVYGWFDRADRGVYALHEAGRQALGRYPELVVRLRAAARRSAPARAGCSSAGGRPAPSGTRRAPRKRSGGTRARRSAS
jgi:hypothetical protein